MIRNPERYYAILMSFALLALLSITVAFRAIDAPIERDIADIQREIAAMREQAVHPIQSTTELTQAPTAPYSVEFRGNTFHEGQIIVGDLTHYCACSICNGKWTGITIDGTVLDENTSPVVGCNWLPLGAVIAFDGQQYRVADRGGKGLSKVGRLDVYVPGGHQAALDKGRLPGVEITIIHL